MSDVLSVSDQGKQWAVHELGDEEAIDLTVRERALLRRLADETAARHSQRAERWHLDSPTLLFECEQSMRRRGPLRLVSALASFRAFGTDSGALLVRGLPLDDTLPPTPDGNGPGAEWHTVPISSIVQLMATSVLGEVVSYADEKQGSLIQDVAPAPGAEARQENTGSCLLELHTEDGFHPEPPRYLSLLGLRGDTDREAWTVTSGIRRAVRGLDGGARRLLARPAYHIALASSFVGAEAQLWSLPVPVLHGSAEDPELCADFHAIRATDDAGWAALERLRRALLAELRGHRLEPGDLLIVDNGKAVHGRTAFTPRYNGTDRWLRRCLAVGDLRRTSHRRLGGSRVLAPLAAGDVQGPAPALPDRSPTGHARQLVGAANHNLTQEALS